MIVKPLPNPPHRTIWILQLLADWGFSVFHVAVVDFLSNAFKCRYDLGTSIAYLSTFNSETGVEIGELMVEDTLPKVAMAGAW